MFKNSNPYRNSLSTILSTHLWLKLLIALTLGVGTGMLFLYSISSEFLSQSIVKSLVDWIALPGSLYLLLIQMVIVPLILSSLILSLADISKLAKAKSITLSAAIFILISTIGSALIGLVITGIFRPGDAIYEASKSMGTLEAPKDGLLTFSPQLILDLVPVNPLATLVKGDLLDIMIISLIFGMVISKMDKSKSAMIIEFLDGTQALCMQLITWTVKLAPYAVFGLMTRSVVNSGTSVLFGMLGYLACAFLGFIVVALCWLAWLSFIGTNPIKFLKLTKEPLLLAFSLSSSAATMPTTLKTAKEKLDVPEEIADFLIPMGTALNMAGSTLWQSSATFFLAQAFGGTLDLSMVITVVILTLLASIGTPGVPGAGVGVLNKTLKSVGVPSSGIPLILGVDRLVDMGCTVINVLGDLIMCKTTLWAIREKKEK